MKVEKADTLDKDAAEPRESVLCVGVRVAMPAMEPERS